MLKISICVFFLIGCSHSADIGEDCTRDSECTTPFSRCEQLYQSCSGSCVCSESYYAFSPTECRPGILLGEPCEYHEDCQFTVRHSECGPDDICKCAGREEVYEHEGIPYCYLWLAGEQCLERNETKCLTYRLDEEYGICDENCTCDRTKLVEERCMPYELGEDCVADDVCESNTQCISDVCSCPAESDWDDAISACVSTAESRRDSQGNGKPCNQNHEDPNGLVCKPWLICDTCPGEDEQKCQVEQRILNVTNCVTDDDCSWENSYCHHELRDCVEGLCKCSPDFYLASDELCKPRSSVGDACTSTADCRSTVEFSVCGATSLCECPAGETLGEHNGKTYCYVAAMGEACTTDEQCLSWRINSYGRCDQGFCVCHDAYRPDGEECIKRKWQESCEVEGGGGGICDENMSCEQTPGYTCQCPAGTTWDFFADQCVSTHEDVVSRLVSGESCSISQDIPTAQRCNPWLSCDACPEDDAQNYVCQNMHQFQDYDISCDTDANCTEANSHCAYLYESCDIGKCRCDQGYYLKSDWTCALAGVLGGECIDSEDCNALTAYSSCVSGTCSCAPGESVYEHDGKSYCYKTLAGEAADQPGPYGCLTYRLKPHAGDLVDGSCDCRPEYILIGETCETVEWNENCTLTESEDMQCVDTTICMENEQEDKVCQCPDFTTVWDVGYERCINSEAEKNLPVGEVCNDNYDATDGLLCDTSLRCARCSEDQPKTCKDFTIGRCTVDADCKSNHGVCALSYESCEFGVCNCDVGYYQVSPTECRRGGMIGEACDTDADCLAFVSNSTCEDNICACGAGEDVHFYDGKSYCYLKSAGELCNDKDECLTYRINPEAGDCIGSDIGDVCLCTHEYKLDDQVCLPANFGENCDVDGTLQRACAGNSQCTVVGDGKICDCLYWQSWNFFSEMCVSNAAIRNGEGETCDRLNNICKPWLTCDSCPWEPEEQTYCQVVDDNLSNLCNSNANCSIPNSYCSFEFEDCEIGKCECIKGFYFASDFTCREGISVGNECDTSEDCQSLLPNSICTEEKICACRDGESSYEYDGVSYCYVYLAGEQCHWSTSDDCLTYRIDSSRAACRDTLGDKVPRCDCSLSYLLVDEACVEVTYGEECRFDNNNNRNCVESTECIHDGESLKCLCPENYRWDGALNLCIHDDAQKNIGIGEECNSFYNSSGLICSYELVCGKCPGDDGPEVCHPPTGDIDGVCSVDTDCLATNSYCHFPYEGCDTGTCVCIDGFYAPVGSSLLCEPIKYIDEPCEEIEECRRGVAYSSCQDNACSCVDGEELITIDGREYCSLSEAREICYYPNDCLSFRIDSDKGDCIDQTTCGCRENYLLEGEVCVAASFGESCEVNGDEKECEANSQCDDSSRLCVCAADTTWQTDYMHCVHDTAETHLSEGDLCNLDYASENGLICDPTLECDACDTKGEEEPAVCQMPRATQP